MANWEVLINLTDYLLDCVCSDEFHSFSFGLPLRVQFLFAQVAQHFWTIIGSFIDSGSARKPHTITKVEEHSSIWILCQAVKISAHVTFLWW